MRAHSATSAATKAFAPLVFCVMRTKTLTETEKKIPHRHQMHNRVLRIAADKSLYLEPLVNASVPPSHDCFTTKLFYLSPLTGTWFKALWLRLTLSASYFVRLSLVVSLKPIKLTPCRSCPSGFSYYLTQHHILSIMIMSTPSSGNDVDSISEMSSSLGNDRTDVPVGLSNSQYVAQKRKMLDAVNRLRETG